MISISNFLILLNEGARGIYGKSYTNYRNAIKQSSVMYRKRVDNLPMRNAIDYSAARDRELANLNTAVAYNREFFKKVTREKLKREGRLTDQQVDGVIARLDADRHRIIDPTIVNLSHPDFQKYVNPANLQMGKNDQVFEPKPVIPVQPTRYVTPEKSLEITRNKLLNSSNGRFW